MHKPVAVANKMLEVAQATDDPAITPMQLIKLVYLAHGWMLGLYGRPLLNESVEAWKYGPVVRSLYRAISHYKDKPVQYPIKGFLQKAIEANFDPEEESVIEQVYRIYGKWDGITLSRLTHMDGSPWYITWNTEGQNAVISNDLIENHYREKYEQSQKAA